MLRGREYLKKLRLGACDTLLSTLDKDFISLELLTSSTISLGSMARKSYLDTIFLLEPNGILSALTNQ
jgi:hypothetical protein